MAGSMVFRLEIGPVGSPEMGKVITAMKAIQARLDNKSFNFIAGFHGAPPWYCWHHPFYRRTPLQARLFLPSHRAYVWTLGQALQEQRAYGLRPSSESNAPTERRPCSQYPPSG